VATVPVQGGLLTYAVLDGTTEPVLAIHGVSSQRRLWNWLHAEAPEPAYPDDLVERYEPYTVEMRSLSGLDHAGTVMTHSGAAAVAEVIKEALRAGSQS
jgi:hypothetical protein